MTGIISLQALDFASVLNDNSPFQIGRYKSDLTNPFNGLTVM